MKFKIGDRVKGNSKASRYTMTGPGTEWTVQECRSGGVIVLEGFVVDGDCFDLIELTNKTNMNLKEKFITAFLSEPEKTFRKAGITNGDGLLTDEGQKVFLSYLLKKEGITFKTEVVDVLLAEEKE